MSPACIEVSGIEPLEESYMVEALRLVVFAFLMTFALHLWRGLPVDLFVTPISYVTGIEREQGSSGSHQQPCRGFL